LKGKEERPGVRGEQNVTGRKESDLKGGKSGAWMTHQKTLQKPKSEVKGLKRPRGRTIIEFS